MNMHRAIVMDLQPSHSDEFHWNYYGRTPCTKFRDIDKFREAVAHHNAPYKVGARIPWIKDIRLRHTPKQAQPDYHIEDIRRWETDAERDTFWTPPVVGVEIIKVRELEFTATRYGADTFGGFVKNIGGNDVWNNNLFVWHYEFDGGIS